ncbi:hypothetical protein SAMN02745213_01771 [Succinivibrio dextrinosolvens DSM 3072]|uniref:Initiator Replication protein n=1 Tax=Succinivibrio dextrinosolvens DSM 3072 TaxID=1123324 RepID=A0A1T4VNU9_9GAMM|nr:hypothetical protein [Succinivibrio dextrinosolvens]SKA66191.1 hypothetical protein SAMN02745213_01771 [Succinivibrio dextrinosolvens DSM 3072]
MTRIIANKEKNKEITNANLLILPPAPYKFSLIRLDYPANLAIELKKQNIKYSIAALFDIAPLLTLIEGSLKKEKNLKGKSCSFIIDCKEYAKMLYRGEETQTNKNKCSKNFYKVLHLINAIDFSFPNIKSKNMNSYLKKNRKEKHIIKFKLEKGNKCVVTITEEFNKYVEKKINQKTGNCIRIFEKGRKYLGELRQAQRAYAYFIEEIYYQSEIELNKDPIFAKRKKIERLNFLFSNESIFKKKKDNSSHQFSFTEIKKAAEKAFRNKKIGNQELHEIVLENLNNATTQGISPQQIYENGRKAFAEIKEAQRLGKTDEEMKQIFSFHSLNPRQKNICRMIANQQSYGVQDAL